MKSRYVVAITILTLASACTPSKSRLAAREANRAARSGNWEEALARYRVAAAENPADATLQDKLARAKREVAKIELAKAAQANASGRLGEAGERWHHAIDLTDDVAMQQQARDAIAANASALESFGDASAQFYGWSDAIGAYGALLLVRPDDLDLLERYREAKREYAGDLTVASDELTRRNLHGAALVAGLKALANDPMQPAAYERVSTLRRSVASRAKVAINDVTIDDKGNKVFGLALAPRLTPKIDDYAPYGPTKDPAAVQGKFLVTIETYEKNETVNKGESVMPNEAPAPKDPVPNPAIDDQQKKVAQLQAELNGLQGEIKKAMPSKGSRPNGSKKSLNSNEEAKRAELLELGRKVDAKRKQIVAEKAVLAAMPSTVPPPEPPKTWTLPWVDVTRTIEARVRFELQEKDNDQPIVLTITKKVTHTDRQHGGNEKQGLLPDPLELPGFEDMNNELADQFVDGADVIARARARRVDSLLTAGREKRTSGDSDAALDAFIEAMFITGPQALPDDVRVAVTRETDEEALDTIVGGDKKQQN